jgi:TolA-binding protein
VPSRGSGQARILGADTAGGLYFLGNHYLETRQAEKAEALYQRLIQGYPGHEVVPLAKAGLAQRKIQEGDPSGAEAIYQKILTDHPNYPRLPEIAVLMAQRYFIRGSEEQARK